LVTFLVESSLQSEVRKRYNKILQN
jgi:hypothetical protein